MEPDDPRPDLRARRERPPLAWRPWGPRPASWPWTAICERPCTEQERATVMLAAAPSQSATLDALAHERDVDWSRVDCFHMDDYLGLAADAPQGFGAWLQRAFVDRVPGVTFHRMRVGRGPRGGRPEAYARVMPERPFDLVLLGLGVNGHLAFNDPPGRLRRPAADTRVVTLDEVSRRQQVDEGHFPTVEDVPQRADHRDHPAAAATRGTSSRRCRAWRSGPRCRRRSPPRSARIMPRYGPADPPGRRPVPRHRVGAAGEREQPGAGLPHDGRRRSCAGCEGRTEAEHVEARRAACWRSGSPTTGWSTSTGRAATRTSPPRRSSSAPAGSCTSTAILDEGTLLSNGALRSMAVERLPGYGRVVIERAGLTAGDVLVLVNAYGINSALIDAAMTARDLGVTTVGVSSRAHAEGTAPDHPARHPSGRNLHDLVDVHIDTKVPVGDAVVEVPGASERTAAVSTFANAFAMNWLVMTVVEQLAARGIDPPMWRRATLPAGTRRTPGSSPGSKAGSATCEHLAAGLGPVPGGRRRGPLAW